jgi:hypothetical protein
VTVDPSATDVVAERGEEGVEIVRELNGGDGTHTTPNRSATSVTATPDWTSNTARYRCSVTLNSTSSRRVSRTS